ncbi:MAG: DUF1805 domain-containing protein [Candidatus Micrarchaeota archaeon]|nr:DUF1805 domain-containing protein [Candidatus Micrarchaeota archaeon]
MTENILSIELGNMPMFIYKGKVGYIVSLYLDIEAAEKVGDIAAVSASAKTKEQFLKAKLRKVTSWAEKVGLKPGMQVRRAIKILESKGL